jgi:hypothetical protein
LLLLIIFNKSLWAGVVPSAWKLAEITPIFKKGKKTDAGNYRPVSLTSVVCKVMESLMKSYLVRYFETNDLFTVHQHGFMSGRSCLTNLLETFESWTEALDKGNSVDAVYLDYQKAFDTVPHRRLLHKLQAYGISGSVLEWINSFLTSRSMRVSVRGSS